MKTLNLDQLLEVKQTVTINGKTHDVKEMSVEDFIAASKEAKELEGMDKEDFAQNVERSISHLLRVLPTVPRGELQALNLNQLAALVRFINGTLEEEGQKAPSTEGDAGNVTA